MELYRIIDANLNRLREGVRVVEDIFRYLYNEEDIFKRLKGIRHKLKVINKELYLPYRDVKLDIGKESTKEELKRESIKDIIKANILRAQEASRVLEEIFKIKDFKSSLLFKEIRYELYDIEKEIFSKIS